MPESSGLSATERTRHRRLREQGSTDRRDLQDILAAGVICHLGVIVDGRPINPRAAWNPALPADVPLPPHISVLVGRPAGVPRG